MRHWITSFALLTMRYRVTVRLIWQEEKLQKIRPNNKQPRHGEVPGGAEEAVDGPACAGQRIRT
ncbi:hypothetical protein [Devosia sp.]|uniref:hypothetical protein n=1 Tax=Devosia sp. TaxID=1871048 RepID=UPI003A8F3B23